jgi:hypothetical protein
VNDALGRIEKLEEEVRKLKEQHTEPVKTVQRPGIESTLENHTELLKEISTKQDEQEQQLTLIYTDVGHMKADGGVLKQQGLETRADITAIKATQSDHGELLQEMQKTISESAAKVKETLEAYDTRLDIRDEKFDKVERSQRQQSEQLNKQGEMLQELLDWVRKQKGEE